VTVRLFFCIFGVYTGKSVGRDVTAESLEEQIVLTRFRDLRTKDIFPFSPFLFAGTESKQHRYVRCSEGK
jgi:hypothetical protein